MFITAVNRAQGAAFLRSSYMKLYDVYGDEEADEFKEEAKKSEKMIDKKEYEKLINNQKRYNSLLKQMSKLVALDDDDDEYPKAYVEDIWDIHQDLEYLKNLTAHENKVIQFVAANKVKEIEIEMEAEKQKQEDQNVNEVNDTKEEPV